MRQRREEAGELKASPINFLLIASKLIQTKAYICSEQRGNYKNNQNHKVLGGIKWEETKNCNKNLKRQQADE